ncbi:MAG: membrane protein [Methylibium sp. NZG]|nr:MAG: membrane protein [Methylibium sp. NZG]
MSSASSASHAFDRRQIGLLVFITLAWGFNWPVLKTGVTDFPPWTFRTLSMLLGLPVLYVMTRSMKVPLHVPRHGWRELAVLTFTNMIVWHVVAIVAIQALSSGRAAILGYTMPIFSALVGAALFGQRLAGRQWLGVAAAAVGVALLLWHELAHMAGRPWAALGMLMAAAVWALGTQQLRRTQLASHTLALGWWMTIATTVVMGLLAIVFERGAWRAPPPAVWFAVIYNAVLIFGIAQPLWLVLARELPPVASTLSVMMIPVLGALSGAWLLGETLHWQDGAAVVLMLAAIGSVLWPSRGSRAAASGG